MPAFSSDTMQSINAFWPFLLMAVVCYFMLYRPQKKEQQKRSRLLDGLKRGDRIVTVGGIYGTIVTLGEKKVTLRIAEKVEIDISRTAVSYYQDAAKQESV